MGAPGWRQVLNDYADAWARGDTQAAWHHIQERLPASERGAALSPEAMHLALSRALMTSVFNRYFLVVFWYLLGGLPLALLARGLVALADHWPAAPARERYRQAAQWLAWIPARLLSCTFGVAGDFAGWSRDIRRVLPGFGRSTDDVLITAANGSLTGYALTLPAFRKCIRSSGRISVAAALRRSGICSTGHAGLDLCDRAAGDCRRRLIPEKTPRITLSGDSAFATLGDNPKEAPDSGRIRSLITIIRIGVSVRAL